MKPRDGLLALACVGLVASGYWSNRKRKNVPLEMEPETTLVEVPPEQPKPPAGWTRFRGVVSPYASKVAREALGSPIGTLYPFLDDSPDVEGRAHLGAFVEWHFDNARGWHKGVSLLVRPS